MLETLTTEITFWSQPGQDRFDPQLAEPAAELAAFSPDGRFYAGRLRVPATGNLVLNIVSPRPLRLWVGGTLALDEGLLWRWYEREVRAAVIIPCAEGEVELLVEVGPRSEWPKGIDDDCPSRNRKRCAPGCARAIPTG